MDTVTHNLGLDTGSTPEIHANWLAVSGRHTLGLLVLFSLLLGGCAVLADTGDSQERGSEASMRMLDGDTGPVARLPSEGWRTCDVVRVGAGWDNIYLRLVCSGVSERWFIARKDQENEILATGLTAVTLNNTVQVYLEHKSTGYHEIRACYVIR